MFYVSISNVAVQKVRIDAQENIEKEVIGLLTGRMENNVLVIEDAITGEITSERTRASLTPEAIAKIADSIISGKVQGNIVGWYHSHPGFGVFISDIDMRTQMKLQQFSPYIVSLVIDPTKDEIGFFTIDMHTKSPVLINEEYTHMFNPGEEVIPPKFQEQTREEPYPRTQSDFDAGRPNRNHSGEMRAASNSRRPRILYTMVIVVAVACLLVASSIIILLPRPEGTSTAIEPKSWGMLVGDNKRFFADFSEATPPLDCTWYIRETNETLAPVNQKNASLAEYVLESDHAATFELFVNITDSKGVQMRASQNATVQVIKRPASIDITDPKPGKSFVWGEKVKINGTLVLWTEDPFADLWRTQPNVNLTISAAYSNRPSISTNYACTVKNGTFQSEPIQWDSPAKITLEAVFLGNETYERNSTKIEFEVGKRNTNLTIDTIKSKYISGSLTDIRDGRAIVDATIVVRNQTEPSTSEIGRNQTDSNGKYAISGDYAAKPPGNYTLFAEFGGNDLYNASFSKPQAVYPNSTAPVDGFKKLASVGGNATFRVNVTNTGFLRDAVNIALSYQSKNSSGGYNPVPNVTINATVPNLLPNQET